MNQTSEYIKICRLSDIKEGRTKVVHTDNVQILLARTNGDIHAYEANCTHEDLPIGEGEINGGEILCSHHGGKYDAKTGQATGFPAIIDLNCFKVKVENGDVYISVSLPERI